MNGDRVNDLAVSAPSQDVDGVADQGFVYVFSGSNGQALYTIKDPDRQESFTDFGGNIVSPGDLNGDGIGDLAVTASAHDRGALRRAGGGYAFSGKDGALLYRVQDPEPQNQARLGFGIAAPGDVNNDGIGDIYFGVPFFDEGTLSDVGRGVVFNGRTGAPLLVIRHPDPHAGARFGQVDAQPGAPGDVNRDGFRDVYVNGFIQNVGQLVGAGRGYVFSGRDASLLLRLDDPTPVHGGQFGNAVAPGGDLDKDRRADLLVGENPHHVSDAENIGGAHVFGRGLTRPLISFEHPAPQRDSIFGAALAAPGDVNGDGEPDYWIAAPSMDVGGNQNQGRVFVFLSRGPGRVTGTGRNERLVGTSGPDRIFGGGGNDVINGLAGRDRLAGGPGHDRVLGGAGGDRLEGDAGNDVLNGGTGDDELLGGGGLNRYVGGSGDDAINSANGSEEVVACGPGRDVVRADPRDRLSNCERARRG